MSVHLPINFIILSSSALIAIYYPNFYDIISLIGSTGLVIIGITLPGILYVKTSPKI